MSEGTVYNAQGRINRLSVLCIDAYGVAVKNGFKGTVEEWLASLKGEPGEPGEKGDPGDKPVRGTDYWTEEDKLEMVSDVLASEEVTKIQQDILDIRADMNYNPITINSIKNNVGTVETGTNVTEMTVTWTLSKTPKSQTLGGEALGVDVRSKKVDMTGKTSVSLVVTDERDHTVSKSTGYTAYSGVYYGAVDADAVISSAVINALPKSLQSGLTGTFKFSGNVGQKMTFAAPVSYGEPSKFVIGGLDYIWTKLEPFEHENASGFKTNYNVWQNSEVLTGSRTLDITVKK